MRGVTALTMFCAVSALSGCMPAKSVTLASCDMEAQRAHLADDPSRRDYIRNCMVTHGFDYSLFVNKTSTKMCFSGDLEMSAYEPSCYHSRSVWQRLRDRW